MGWREGKALAESEPGLDAVFVHAEGESIEVTSGLEGRFERFSLD
jgi:hypothetical protein